MLARTGQSCQASFTRMAGVWREILPPAHLKKHGSLIVVFPPGVDTWNGVMLVMQPPLQAHMNLAALLSAVAALALIALFAHWLTRAPEDRAGCRERAWYPEF